MGVSLIGLYLTSMHLAQLWRILSFCFHQLQSSRGPQDGLHHQQQNIFRNTTSPGSAAWSFLLIGYAWRHKTRRPILRSWPWAVLATCRSLASCQSSNRKQRKPSATNAWSRPRTVDIGGSTAGRRSRRKPRLPKKQQTTPSWRPTMPELATVAAPIPSNAMSTRRSRFPTPLIKTQHVHSRPERVCMETRLPSVWTLD